MLLDFNSILPLNIDQGDILTSIKLFIFPSTIYMLGAFDHTLQHPTHARMASQMSTCDLI